MTPNKHDFKTVVSLIITLGALALIPSCAPPKTMAPLPPKVTVSQPRITTVTNWDQYPGHLEAVEMVELRPRVTGYLDSIHFQDGAEVKAGDLLFVIDPRPYQADWERFQAERQRAETHLDLAKNDLKRAETLRSTRAISEEELDSRSKAFREAEAALASALASEATSRINLDFTRIKAPISGRIGRRLMTIGNLVQMQGSGGAATVLATIVSLEPIYCYFDADEASFLRYRSHGADGNGLGQKDSFLACELGLVNEEAYPHQGRVDFYDNEVDAKTGTIRLRAVFANQHRALVPGLFAKVRVPAGPPVESMLIPDVAVGSDQGRSFVFIVNKDNVIETRQIKKGRQQGAYRSIEGGLAVQDRVVVNGLMLARPGAKVEVQKDLPTGAEPKAEATR